MKKYDVIVIGGGFAGFAAALSAARGGAKVLIVEKSNCFGGAAINNLVNPFMSYWTILDGRRVDLAQGIFKKVRLTLEERGAMSGRSFLEEELKRIMSEELLAAGVDFLFHAYLSDVQKENDKIASVTVATIGGKVTLEAEYFIDATGDAQLAFLAECPTVLGREPDRLCQPMTLCFRLGNVDVERFFESKDHLNELYAKALANGEISNPRENILVFKTPIPNVLHFNTTRVVKKNPTDAFEVTEAEIMARQQVYEVYDFMKRHADGLENSYLMMTAPEIGVRESRMIVGDYVLTEADCRAFTKFDDAIAACNYDIDIHNPEGTGTSHYYFPAGKYYTIPYRSLIPQTVENLLVAGRCISGTHRAHASYRVMSICMAMGEAVGIAAAISAKFGVKPRNIPAKDIQKILIERGVALFD